MPLHVLTDAGAGVTPTAACWPDTVRASAWPAGAGGPEHPLIERIAADATDADALPRLAEARGR
ncbi:hypothetical protein MXD63_25790 [Frankia sp. Cpl3]|nr:hypothetical protein [Parafrankia colletiae]MCK9903452.1 hypothetical protein [Frankia sp. Cpl3]